MNVKGEGYEAMWGYFGLSRPSWLTMPRVMIHDMPDEWQAKLAELMSEWDATWVNQPNIGTRVQVTDGNGAMIKTPEWVVNYRYPDRDMLAAIKTPKVLGGE